MLSPFFICVFTYYGYTKNIYSKEEKIWEVEVYFIDVNDAKFLFKSHREGQDNVKIVHISTFLSR